MNLEMFKTLTPFLLFFITVIQAGMGFFMVYLLKKVDRLERQTQKDLIKNFEKFVAAEVYYMGVGKIDALIGEIFKQLEANNATLNQVIGEFRAKDKQ